MSPARPSVGLVIVDTESYVLANNAIQHSVQGFPFASVTVFTDAVAHWSQYRTVPIPRIASIEDYNHIILESLPAVVDTDFVLVIQYDGFILDGGAFDDRFYACDYIGAVWPDYPYMRVGNGGFSWRSRKLIEAVARLAHLRPTGQAEDLFICRTVRPLLEAVEGCTFADESLAGLFSYEIVPGTRSSFGFHGIFNLPLVYRNNLRYLVENLPLRVLSGRLPYLRHGAARISQEALAELDSLAADRGVR